MSNSEIHYRYTHSKTTDSTGYFSCEPEPLPSLRKLAALLLERPLDTFLRRHAVKRFGALAPSEAQALLEEVATAESHRTVSQGFLAELAAIYPAYGEYFPDSPAGGSEAEGSASPLVTLRRQAFSDYGLHAAWGAVFRENSHAHRSLRSLDFSGLEPLYPDLPHGEPGALTLGKVHQRFAQELRDLPEAPMTDPAEVAELALERLRESGIVAGAEQRHLASLSPVGLLMPWRLDVRVNCGRHRYRLSGETNTYGRGVTVDQARASCRMEMVERASAYLSVNGDMIENREVPLKLRRESLSGLLQGGAAALDPNLCYLEAPYSDEELYWLQAERLAGNPEDGAESVAEPIWVPFQAVSLFPNLDEADLCSAPGSTGLASGLSLEQAKLAALTEILERDTEATTLYDKSRCFVLEADANTPDRLAQLLEDYARLGVNVQFMDITGPLGVPCYQCFVLGPRGSVHAGYGAGLSGGRAIVSALTETPYPYPSGGPSGPRLRNLPVRKFGELPDYSLGGINADLRLLERFLCANGLNPVYVRLTRNDLRLPVVRAIVPGMQPTADFDVFSRIAPRLYADYLRLRA